MSVKVTITNGDPFVRKVELYDTTREEAQCFKVGPFDALTIPLIFGEFEIVVRDID